jgi:hypothetical protein
MTLEGGWRPAEAQFASTSEESAPSEETPTVSESTETPSESSGAPSVVYVDADNTLRKDAPRFNEGGNPFIRVGARPIRRGLLQFDPDLVAEMRAQLQPCTSLYLTLQIAANGNNWSQSDDHFVDVHPLPVDFSAAEGIGRISGLPGDQIVSSTSGVTWNSLPIKKPKKGKKPVDKGFGVNWRGGSNVMAPATAPGILHVNGLYGSVSWDVTEDVLSGAAAWIIKIRDEHEPGHKKKAQGFDPFRGSVDYFSREGASAVIGDAHPPLLQLVDLTGNGCGSTSDLPSGSLSESESGSTTA